MEAAIEMAESGHLVIGTLHTKSCAEAIDRMINFYEVRDQDQIKYLLSARSRPNKIFIVSSIKTSCFTKIVKRNRRKISINTRSYGS